MDFLRLPANADDGFPQAFAMRFGGRGYTVVFEVSLLDEPPPGPMVLPRDDAYLVLSVAREETPGDVIFRRKLVPGHEYVAEELVFRFTEMVVDPRNLNATGAFGSRVTGGVAARWAS
jgi:hypothetical protein